MPRRYPVRGTTHLLEELSERYFRARLPDNWTCEKQSHDYGVDLRIDIFEDYDATGLELLVQLKAARVATGARRESVRLRTATYNYLRDKLQLAMLVKFVADDNEAYWMLVKDIPKPNQQNKTFSVRIPKKNRLSVIDWAEIQRYVRNVTDTKLAAIRRSEIGRRRQRLPL